MSQGGFGGEDRRPKLSQSALKLDTFTLPTLPFTSLTGEGGGGRTWQDGGRLFFGLQPEGRRAAG